MKVTYDVEKLKKVAAYVGATRPVVEKAAADEAVLQKRVPQVVDAMVEQGLVSPHLKEAKVKALLANPSELLDTIEKMAELIPAPSLGSGSSKVEEKTDANTVFTNRLMGGR
jgi:hypothetical protein